ncbi:Hypothetical predicted protein [Cloeon dipterum]|uniref:Uncharacterized protein n=1 Tax=Cloeon dipterum TaxID=197152 RepID=A0A8S1CR71_9INSE|nr:Hypothetical predicted protein [Cloeon dipterum]
MADQTQRPAAARTLAISTTSYAGCAAELRSLGMPKRETNSIQNSGPPRIAPEVAQAAAQSNQLSCGHRFIALPLVHGLAASCIPGVARDFGGCRLHPDGCPICCFGRCGRAFL